MRKKQTTYIDSLDSAWTTGDYTVDDNHQDYIEDVRQQAEQCFMRLDSAVSDFKDHFGKTNRDFYLDSVEMNLENLEYEIASLKELVEDKEKLDAIDQELVFEKLKEEA
jgi:paraquat-inducible protein B